MNSPYLFGKSLPGLHVVVATDPEFCDQLLDLEDGHLGAAVRHVRGKKCATVASLFDEFAAALQFPWYFGENWDAFSECLADLDWLRTSSAIIGISHARHLLQAEASERPTLLRILDRVCNEWSTEKQQLGESGEFHLIFHATADEVAVLHQLLSGFRWHQL